MKIFPKGAELFYADRQTGRRAGGRTNRHEEANTYFSQFCQRT